ncbi:hypothetical protein FO519_009603, partial [Halicephalobus sp. NKZ332]
QITFNWFTELAIKGYKKPLEPEDLWDLNERDISKYLKKFQTNWDNHLLESDLSRNKPRSWFENPENSRLSRIIQGRKIYIKSPLTISAPLFKTLKWPFLTGALYKFVFDLLQFAAPQLLKHLINFIQDRTKPMWIGIGISILMFTVILVQSIFLHQYFHRMTRVGMNITSALTSIVYRKALFLSNKAKKKRTVGEIVNLMSVDIQRVREFTAYLNTATSLSWASAPFLFIVVTFGTYIAIDPENNVLTPQITFVALSLFNIMRFPLALLTTTMNQAVQSYVSNERLKSFLAEDEIESLPFDRVESEKDAEEVKEVLEDLEQLDPIKTKEIQRQISTSLENIPLNTNTEPVSSPKNSEFGLKSVDDQKKPSLLNRSQLNGIMKKSENPSEMNKKAKLIKKEEMKTGKVKFNVYRSYLKAIGLKFTVLCFIIYIISGIFGVCSNLYLASWSDHAAEIQKGGNGSIESRIRIGVYTALGVGQVFFVCTASVLMALGMVIASKILHERMLTNILRSPMSFFDVTPLGRIMNRFGKDIYVTDTTLPASLMSMVSTIIQAFFIISVPVIVTPWILAPLVPILYSYFQLLRFYISTSRQLKRLESAAKSPIYSHFQESIQGATSIRAYKCVEFFLLESQKKVDNNLASYYPSVVANRWLAVRLELVGNLIVLFSVLLGVLWRDSPGVTPGLIGLSVSYALSITQILNLVVRMTGELETNVVAIERIKEYSETPTEAALETGFKLPKDWPTRDEELWKALKLTHMDIYVSSLTDLLDYKVTEGGENLSVGQRQLICLARALLRKSKILVLDEAAASVDMETDQLIQRTIKEQFADCTVLTIAHRLHSVIDSDRLMVLDSGKIAEFQEPQSLLKDSDSVFYSMALDAGLVTE